jgi:Flp pilus assembly protein TadB
VETWLIIVIVVAAAILLLALVLWAVKRGRKRRVEKQRAEAGALRRQAEIQARHAEERHLGAREELERAEREREVARGYIQRADEVDPDVDADRPGETSRTEERH